MAKHVSPETTTTGKPTKARPRGRPKSPTQAVAKAIYFRDQQMVEQFNKLVEKHPRSSASAVIQQMVGKFIEAYEKTPPTDNKLEFTTTVYF